MPPTTTTRRMSEFEDIPGDLLHNAAQASRLRRRGAIRSAASRTDLFIPGSHTFGRDGADALLIGALRGATTQCGVRRVICGRSEEDGTDGEDDHIMGVSERKQTDYWPSPLPTMIDLRPSKVRPTRFGTSSHRPSRRIESGCGTVLHYTALSVPRLRSCAARIDLDDEDATVGSLPESTHPVPRPVSLCGCASERVGCLRCGNEVGVRYKPCERHAARVVRASVLFDLSRTHLDEPFAESAPADADGEDSDSDSGSSSGLHHVLNTLSSLMVQQRQPLRSPPPVPTPLRAGLSPMLALSELPRLLSESGGLPATGANATPLSPVSMTIALRRPLRDEADGPSTPVDGDMADLDVRRSTPMPARRVRRKRSESIER